MNLRIKKLSADDRRAKTVQTVIAIAAEQDPSEITTATIAKRMQVTQGALFRHFPSKESLWGSVMSWVSEQLLIRIERATLGVESPMAALQAMFMAHIEFVSEHPGVPRMIFGILQKPKTAPTRKMAQQLLEMYATRLQGLIERAKEQGEVYPELDTRDAALLFIGSIQGLVMQSMMSGNIRHMRKNAPGIFVIYQRGMSM